MQIFVSGFAKRYYQPDQVNTTTRFEVKADTYEDALRKGVARVAMHIDLMSQSVDINHDDFKTDAYSVCQNYRYETEKITDENGRETTSSKRVKDGFTFYQTVKLDFDYDREKLAKMLVLSAQVEDSPNFNFTFSLKDTYERRKELIADAYRDAKDKAQSLAEASSKHLRDCVRTDIDETNIGSYAPSIANSIDGARYGASMMKSRMAPSEEDTENQIRLIDKSFRPNDILVTKNISCIWETID